VNGVGERNRLAVYTALWLAAVLAGLILYVVAPHAPVVAPFADGPPRAVALSVWSALLGSLAVSIKGIVDHRRTGEWSPESGWALWYILRPANGIIVGLATYVFILLVSGQQAPNLAVVSAAAFILGFQERRFLNFVSEVAKLVLTVPGEAAGGLSVSGVSPRRAGRGQLVVIAGRGIEPGAVARVGSSDLERSVVSADGTAIAGLVPDCGQDAQALDVWIANPDGTARRLRGGFTYQACEGEACGGRAGEGRDPEGQGPGGQAREDQPPV
jgi:hypothetical protein